MRYLLLSLLWILMVVIVNPSGEFPLNDDWAYCKDVSIFTATGHLEFVNWPAMTLIAQVLLGSFFCELFGFSFTLLRIVTLITGLAGVLVSYKLLKQIIPKGKLAFIASMLIAVNPLFFSLSNTFMTDVYFFTFSIISIYFFKQSLDSDKVSQIVLATAFVIITSLIRQIGIVFPLAFSIAYLYKSSSFSKAGMLKAATPLLLTGLSLFLYSHWLSVSQPDLKSFISTKTAISIIGPKIFERAFFTVGSGGMSLGLFLFPLLILTLPSFVRDVMKKENRLSLLFTGIMLVPLVRAWTNIPRGNVFYNLGLGPKLLKDTYILNINMLPELNGTGLLFLRVVCFAGAILLFYSLFSFIFSLRRTSQEQSSSNPQTLRLFALAAVVLLFGTFVIPVFFFDRYLIQLMIPLIIIIFPRVSGVDFKNVFGFISIATIVVFGLFSIGATHDYLAWNRARWQGADFLLNDLKILPGEIDGGFEFNAWYETGEQNDGKTKSWWFVDKDDYLISFGPVPGYELIQKFPYRQYLPYETRHIPVQRKLLVNAEKGN